MLIVPHRLRGPIVSQFGKFDHIAIGLVSNAQGNFRKSISPREV
jgi:hypothetical protein